MTTTHVPTAQLFLHPQTFLTLGYGKEGGVQPGPHAAMKSNVVTELADTVRKIKGA